MDESARKVIPAVPSADSTSDPMRGPLQALKNNLEFFGEQVDWNRLLPASGEAFRVTFAESWHVATPQCWPLDVFANGCEAFGYEWEWFLGQRKEEGWRRVKERIDSELPVMTTGLAEADANGWSVVAGYEGNLEQVLCAGLGGDGVRWFAVRGKGDSTGYWVGDVPGKFTRESPHLAYDAPLFVVQGKVREPAPEEFIERAARSAVESAGQESVALQYWGHVEFFFGVEALRLWAKALRELDYEAEKSEFESVPHYGWGHIREVLHANARMIGEGRRAAAEFFELSCRTMPAKAGLLSGAAAHYRRESQLAAELWTMFFKWSDAVEPFELGDEDVAMEFASRRLAERDTCGRAANVILQMRSEESAAVEYLREIAPESRRPPGLL